MPPTPSPRPPPRPRLCWTLGDLCMLVAIVAVGMWGMGVFCQIVEGVTRGMLEQVEVRVIQ